MLFGASCVKWRRRRTAKSRDAPAPATFAHGARPFRRPGVAWFPTVIGGHPHAPRPGDARMFLGRRGRGRVDEVVGLALPFTGPGAAIGFVALPGAYSRGCF